jgi:GTP-binding protein HflX
MDASSPQLLEQRDEVERVLSDIGAAGIAQIVVCNKLDRMTAEPRQRQDWVERPGGLLVPRVFVSARDGTGLDVLRQLIARAASGQALNPVHATPSALAMADGPIHSQELPGLPAMARAEALLTSEAPQALHALDVPTASAPVATALPSANP